ncbi:MAG: divalent-cation tolerance protein CutA [Candidatus Omnitrophica bacterium]|nr:divalent-cation tolerance protein CutA [Candidatus Omnitrophota bacterium]
MKSGRAFLVLTTISNAPQARRLARQLLEKRTAACVTILPAVRSLYRWKGKIEDGGEALLLIKTHRARLAALFRQIETLHPYEVPEILAVPVSRGHPPYLRWLSESLKISVQ